MLYSYWYYRKYTYIYGTNGDDNLVGTDGHDLVFLRNGNDTLSTGDGDDRVYAWRGNKVIDTGNGNDMVYKYGSGISEINTGAGNDRVTTMYGENEISTGTGNDYVFSYRGTNTISLDEGDDYVFSYRSSDQIDAGSGNDTVLSYFSDSDIEGGSGNDRIYALYSDGTVDGQEGNDFIYAIGDVTLQGGAGNDTLYGRSGDQTFIYDVGLNQFSRDYYFAGVGNDTLRLMVTSDVAASQWFQEAIQAFDAFLATASSYQMFNFASYAEDDLLNLSVKGFSAYELEIEPGPNNPPADIALSADMFSELSQVNAVVFTVTSQNDFGETPSYSLLNDADGLFTIDAVTGEVQLTRIVDFEAANSYQIEVEVADGTGLTSTKRFTVSVTDENETPFDVTLSNDHVQENLAAGALVGQVASQNDAGEIPSYSLVNDADGLFTIDSATGEITLTRAVDFETDATSYSIEVEVSDGTGLTTRQSFTISVDDVNETPFDVTLSNDRVQENLAAGALVGQVASQNDAGEIPSYSLVNDAGGLFSIDSETGEITLTRAVDFETDATSYSIEVEVSDGSGLTARQSFTISVDDVNETPWNIELSSNSVDEDAALGTIIGSLSSENDRGEIASYFLVDDVSGLFAIDETTGELSLNSSGLDFETQEEHTITVRAVDSTGLQADKTFTIDVNDVVEDDAEPSLTIADVSIAEGASGMVQNMVFTVELSHASSSDITFDYTLAGLTADQAIDKDFVAGHGHVTISAGSTTATIEVPIWGDNNFEQDETLTIDLVNIVGAEVAKSSAIGTILNDDTENSASLAVPVFNSNSASQNVIYIDFDGEYIPPQSYWAQRYGDGDGLELTAWSRDSDRSSFSSSELNHIEAVWRRVAEDFAPFDVNVTTDREVYDETPNTQKLHHIVTDTNFRGSAGVALYNIWGREDSYLNPSFAFMETYGVNFSSVIVSHEVGHQMGLRHDGKGTSAYYSGHNDWTPIMGNGSKNISQWSKGEYDSASNTWQDDIQIMRNQFGSRVDDHSDDLAGASLLHQGDGYAATGVIETREDVDVFKIEGGFRFTFDVKGLNGNSAGTNLDIMLALKNEDGELLASHNPTDTLNALMEYENDSLDTLYLEVFGVGRGTVNNGFSDYGSLGHYTISMTKNDLGSGVAAPDYDDDYPDHHAGDDGSSGGSNSGGGEGNHEHGADCGCSACNHDHDHDHDSDEPHEHAFPHPTTQFAYEDDTSDTYNTEVVSQDDIWAA